MQKTAYDVRISDWSSDVCSSDLRLSLDTHGPHGVGAVLFLAVVLEVPRPLLAVVRDRDLGVFVLRLEHVLVTGREDEEPHDADQRHNGVEDLDRQVVLQLPRPASPPPQRAMRNTTPPHQAPT